MKWGIKLGDAPFHEAEGFLGRVNLAAIHPLWPHPKDARHSVNVCPSHLKISEIAVVVLLVPDQHTPGFGQTEIVSAPDDCLLGLINHAGDEVRAGGFVVP